MTGKQIIGMVIFSIAFLVLAGAVGGIDLGTMSLLQGALTMAIALVVMYISTGLMGDQAEKEDTYE